MLDHSRAHDIVRPDLAGWRRERLPDPGEQRPISVVPDRVCELLSPGTAARDRVQKRNLYGERGIPTGSSMLTAARWRPFSSSKAGGCWLARTAMMPARRSRRLRRSSEVGRLFLRKRDV
ncbi:MAG: Uma2 family endonuclease [Myxococcales bacterium]|nr:Uma2 family endonuclease [Myxococcales bacterium]